MSAMSELHLQIQELLEQDWTGCEVAEFLNIPVDDVYDVMDSLEETD